MDEAAASAVRTCAVLCERAAHLRFVLRMTQHGAQLVAAVRKLRRRGRVKEEEGVGGVESTENDEGRRCVEAVCTGAHDGRAGRWRVACIGYGQLRAG